MKITKGRLKIDDGDSRKAEEPSSVEDPRGGARAQMGTKEDISSISETRAR